MCQKLPVFLEGEIVHGKGIGHLFGFPTANINTDTSNLPQMGVYASEAEVDGVHYYGVTNIGLRPTVDSSDIPTVETWLDDFDGDIYGKHMNVKLVSFLRGTRKFSDMDELKNQIYADKAKMRAIFSVRNE